MKRIIFFTSESRPRVISIVKNKNDQNEEPASLVTANGNIMNARPGPIIKLQIKLQPIPWHERLFLTLLINKLLFRLTRCNNC